MSSVGNQCLFTYPLELREELPVTFQLGIFARDGVVLASDVLRSTPGSFRTVSSTTAKIVFDNQLGIAYAFSGDDPARYTGEFILSALKDGGNFGQDLIAKAVLQGRERQEREIKQRIKIPSGFANRLLIFQTCAHQDFELWEATFYAGEVKEFSRARRYLGKGCCFSGDMINPAMFIIQQYYLQRDLPLLETVKRLAAHTVLIAGTLGTGIWGLDIVSGKDNRFARIEPAEITQLQEFSDRLDRRIYGEFLENT